MLDESDLDLLTQELRPVQHKWKGIGKDFFNRYFLDEIRHNYSNPDACLRTMLRQQLQDPTTWRNIVDALRSPGVGESQLANELEAKYCPSEFINNNILYFFDQTPRLLLFSLFVLVRLLLNFEGGEQ